MLGLRLPCENVIRLQNSFTGQVDYYLMDTTPAEMLLLMHNNVRLIPCKFKQLTGANVGHIYSGRFNPKLCESKVYVYLNPRDKSKLTVSINGFSNHNVGQGLDDEIDITKKYGKTISIRQLLLLWKIDNKQALDIDIDEDYEMVKRLYTGEDILYKKSEELSK